MGLNTSLIFYPQLMVQSTYAQEPHTSHREVCNLICTWNLGTGDKIWTKVKH